MMSRINTILFLYAIIFFFGCSGYELSQEPATILRDTLSLKIINYCPSDSYSFKEVFFTNLSAVRDQFNLMVDSDRDGLSDETEIATTQAFNVSHLNSDTNGDGYRDLAMVRAGIDIDAQRGLGVCSTPGQDTDRDELIDCEEYLLRTDPLNPDTDFDGIPDGLEVRGAINPLDAVDAFSDFDQDGLSVLQEVKRNTPWQNTNNRDVIAQAFQYSSQLATNGNVNCFDIIVNNVPIIESYNGNLAKFYFLENKVVQGQGDVNRVKTVTVLFPTDALAGIEIEIDGVANQMVTVDQEGNF